MIRVSSESRRIRNGNKNLHTMLNKRGWSWSRGSTTDGDHFVDKFSKRGKTLTLRGVGAWEESKSDFMLYLDMTFEAPGIEGEHQLIISEDDLTFRRKRAHWNSEEIRSQYLRNLNDLCEFAHQVSG